MSQTYHLIPEPAGDWQEGDRAAYIDMDMHRLRPVKAQAGQLWRTVADTDTWINGDRFIPEDGKWVRPLERELNQANATVAALRRELAEAKESAHAMLKRQQDSWERGLQQAEADRDQWRDKAKHWEAIKRAEVKL